MWRKNACICNDNTSLIIYNCYKCANIPSRARLHGVSTTLSSREKVRDRCQSIKFEISHWHYHSFMAMGVVLQSVIRWHYRSHGGHTNLDGVCVVNATSQSLTDVFLQQLQQTERKKSINTIPTNPYITLRTGDFFLLFGCWSVTLFQRFVCPLGSSLILSLCTIVVGLQSMLQGSASCNNLLEKSPCFIRQIGR